VTHYDQHGFQTGELWWVDSDGKRYGPFARARMIEFVAEGRIVAETRVCRSGEDWRNAQHVAFLADALEARTFPDDMDEDEPETQTALIVWARIGSFVEMNFLAALAGLGPIVEIEHGMWIVRTTKPIAAARAKLASVLTTADRLLVAAVSDLSVGWRNLGPTTESRLRDLLRAMAPMSPAND
jgi:hypothetical protein